MSSSIERPDSSTTTCHEKMPSPFAEKAFFQIEGSFRVGKIFLRPFRSSELSRFLDRQKAAQKPPGVRKTRKEHVPSWRRATTRVCKQTVPGACIPVRALSRSRFSQSRNSFYYTFTPLYFYLLCFLLLRVKIPCRIFALRGKRSGSRSRARSGRKDRHGSSFARRLKKPVLEGECRQITDWILSCAG